MRKIIHFNTPEERLAYVKGSFEEIVPKKAEKKPEKKEKKSEEKPKKAAKGKKKGKKDEVQAE